MGSGVCEQERDEPKWLHPLLEWSWSHSNVENSAKPSPAAASLWYQVRNVTVAGLAFRASRYTYMDTHAVPSGGDWALDRNGAIFFQGTERVTVRNCSFERLDGT